VLFGSVLFGAAAFGPAVGAEFVGPAPAEGLAGMDLGIARLTDTSSAMTQR
jgi:hypothetical protein